MCIAHVHNILTNVNFSLPPKFYTVPYIMHFSYSLCQPIYRICGFRCTREENMTQGRQSPTPSLCFVFYHCPYPCLHKCILLREGGEKWPACLFGRGGRGEQYVITGLSCGLSFEVGEKPYLTPYPNLCPHPSSSDVAMWQPLNASLKYCVSCVIWKSALYIVFYFTHASKHCLVALKLWYFSLTMPCVIVEPIQPIQGNRPLQKPKTHISPTYDDHSTC